MNKRKHTKKDKMEYMNNFLFLEKIDFKNKYNEKNIPSNLNKNNNAEKINNILYEYFLKLVSTNNIKRRNAENKKFSIPRRAWNGIKVIEVNKDIPRTFFVLFIELHEK